MFLIVVTTAFVYYMYTNCTKSKRSKEENEEIQHELADLRDALRKRNAQI